ncbi:hypothetical protein GCG54_00013783, partial [Colletotrichum gloeosporioides]
IGGATAVLQLVVALSKTVQVASSAHHDIRRIDDDRIEDFESQLEATRIHLKLLENCISSGTFGEHVCRYAELIPVIKSCDRAYTRLSNIFVKIHRDRSWATSLMAQELYIKQARSKKTEYSNVTYQSSSEPLAEPKKGSQTSFSARQASLALLTSSANATERLSRVSSTLVRLQLEEPHDTNAQETASRRTSFTDLQIDI